MTQRQLLMRVPQLTDLPPALPLPEGYAVRVADLDNAADRDGLGAVLTDAFGEPWDAARVTRVLSEAEGVHAIYVVSGPDGLAATASARTLPKTYPTSGYVHFVGTHSSERGNRLGEIVTRAVLADFAARRLDDAVLETDDFRGAAVRTYLRLGFVPEYREPDDQARWSRVIRQIIRPPASGSTGVS